jgi:hypothetical protein
MKIPPKVSIKISVKKTVKVTINIDRLVPHQSAHKLSLALSGKRGFPPDLLDAISAAWIDAVSASSERAVFAASASRPVYGSELEALHK